MSATCRQILAWRTHVCRHHANKSPTCQQVTGWPNTSGTLADSFLCLVADMLANMSATCCTDKHMSVNSNPVSTCQHPNLPAKGLTPFLNFISIPINIGWTKSLMTPLYGHIYSAPQCNSRPITMVYLLHIDPVSNEAVPIIDVLSTFPPLCFTIPL